MNLSTSAAIAALACAFTPGVVALAPTAANAQEQCGPLPLVGSLVCPTGDYPTGIVYTGVAGDILLDLATGAEVLETVVLDATGDVVLTATGDTLITTDAGEGLVATAGDAVDVTLDAVETTADGGTGLLIDSGGEVNLDIAEVLTSGDTADAINVDAGEGVTLTLGDIGTSGSDSDGVEIVSLSGPVFVDADLIETLGEDSSGVVVDAAGDTDVDVTVLSTEGFEAVGLDLSADPAACLVLGAGACDTSFSVGNLTTEGIGSTGALVRGAGDVTGDVTLLRTEGDDAVGLDIAADPDTCILLGAGACSVDLGGGNVSTGGDGATAVLVRAAGDVVADFGVVATDGDNANAIDIVASPAVCLVIGAGACGVTVDVDEVDTDGDGSDGVVVVTPGPVDVDAGDVSTDGDGAEGIRVDGGALPVSVTAGTVTTAGADAEAIEVSAEGEIDVVADVIITTGPRSEGVLIDGGTGPVTVDVGTIDTAGVDSEGVEVAAAGDIDILVDDIDTTGAGSDGVLVGGATGEVTVDVGSITTTGAGADGINTTTTTGAQVILAGDISATGDGSDGVDAASVSGDIDITVEEDITADADAVIAATDGAVDVTVLAGADVFGGDNGLDLTSGDGTTVVNNGTIEGGSGIAIDIDGAGSTIDNNGTVTGAVDLSAGVDLFTNDGLFEAEGDSDFGAGADVFTNNGEVDVSGDVVFGGLESFVNASGVIDMMDDATDDSLTIPGGFSGGADSELLIDVALGAVGTPADQLVVGGAVTGVTTVTVNNISDGPGVLNPDGVVIVDAGTATDGSFVLDGGTITDGFVDFNIDVDGGDVLLVGSPNQSVFETVKVGQFTQEFWYASADAWSARTAQIRDAELGGRGRTAGGEFWGGVYGADRTHDGEREFTAFGVTSTRDLSYDELQMGFQMGVDWGREGSFWGLTGGFGGSEARFDVSGNSIDITGFNLGAYGGWYGPGSLRIDVLAKVDVFEADYANGDVPFLETFEGRSWGLQAELGYRFGDEGFYVEPQASLAYVSTTLDGFEASAATVEWDDAESLRGKAGVRTGWNTGSVRPYLAAHAVHEFQGENGVTFSSGGFDLPLEDEPDETYGLITFGADTTLAGLDSFLQGEAAFGDVEGWGLKFGVRAKW